MEFKRKNFTIFVLTFMGAVIIGLSILLLVLVFYQPEPYKEYTAQSPPYSQINATGQLDENSLDSDYLYCVKLENGKIVVYKNGDVTPFETIDTDPSVLPKQDLDSLKEGIYIKTDAELQRLLEDFDG